jgi:hypothetical protein
MLFVRKYERFFLFLSLDWKLEKAKKKEGQLRGIRRCSFML